MRRQGFSLLEVIIATAILVAASMTLLRLLSIGQQHQVRAERRATAQSLCQTLVDQQQIGIADARQVDREIFPADPEWAYSVDQQPTEFAGVVRLRVRVWENDEPDLPSNRSERPVFEIVRWMRSPVGGRQ